MGLPEKCTGCLACYNACKFGAITIEKNEKGFYVPIINKEKCRNCNACELKCPEINVINKSKWMKCYAGWSKNETTRLNSTSGGLFYEIASYVLDNNGIVVGACFDATINRVYHEIIRNKKDLKKLQGSKYVQSYIGDIYNKIKKELDDDKLVLFSGVACQISGLKKLLSKEYSNLITVDVLCHGAPSPQIFEDYIKHNGFCNINQISFRHKKPSWNIYSMKINYDSDKEYMKDTYNDEFLRLFSMDYICNDVCETCKYAGEYRTSDITLADFWGYVSETRKYKNNEKGISLILINTNKGQDILEKMQDRVVVFQKDFIEAKNGNQSLRKPFKKNTNYDLFWETYHLYGYKYCIDRFFTPRTIPIKRKISIYINDHAFLFPKMIRQVIYRKKYRQKGIE